MCGIAGIAGLPTAKAHDVIDRMLGRMPYRGPNDKGVWGEKNVTLGHLRLSIIDMSSAGHQPMKSHDGRYILIYNGEIYNYIELKAELEAAGHRFTSQSDSEVLLEAYRAWGDDCVRRFNGMWAFAVYDTQEQRLFCARDRFGIKPFYYQWDGAVLRFGSEMKCLLREGRGTPNLSHLYAFFDRSTPLGTDDTVFEDIHHLRPAHTLVWHKGTMTTKRYWEPDHRRAWESYSYDDPPAQLQELVTDAVRLRLRSDVPVGVCLSGGIDSSVIAVTLASLGVTPMTFSTVYDEKEYSEAEFIDDVNAHIGAKAHRITPKSEDFFSIMEDIVRHHDEPVRMPGVFSHWHVMQCAKPHVTVLLDGQGADEILAGYREYYPSYIASLLRDILVCSSPADAARRIRECAAGIDTHLGTKNVVMKEALLRAIPQAVRGMIARPSQKTRLFSRRAIATLHDRPEELSFVRRMPSVLDRDMMRHFLETNLPMLLRYEDRNSMAFSLEARVPFLDYRVVEYCQGLSYRWKMRGYDTKYVLRRAFAEALPSSVRERKDKKGFPTPVSVWFRGPLRAELERRLTQGAFIDAGLVDVTAVMRLLKEHADGVRDHERTLFRLLTLDLWLRTYAPDFVVR